MKYKVTVTGKRWKRVQPMPNPEKWEAPENWVGYEATEEGIVEIDKTPCFDYGNGKYMSIEEGFGYLPPDQYGQDIRYDKDYDPNDEEGYIEDYAKYWFANEGYWESVDKIKVEKIG